MKRNGPASTAPADATPDDADASVAATVFLSLGANLGDRRATMRRAIEWLIGQPAISLDPTRDIARLYESAPVGCDTDQPAYLNTVVRVRTTRAPHRLLQLTQELERTLGRVRVAKNEARVIDVDMLLYDQTVLQSPELVLPHPAMTRRRFVLEPLCDLAPDLSLPGTKITVALAMQSVCRTYPDQHIKRVADRNWFST